MTATPTTASAHSKGNTPETAKLIKIKNNVESPFLSTLERHSNDIATRRNRLSEASEKQENGRKDIQLQTPSELREIAIGAKKEKLDSVLCTVNSTGEKYSLQTFKYDEKNLPEERVNALWDASSNSWKTIEIYGYTWDDDGYCLSQWGYSDLYNSGQRYDFTYNDRHLGDTQVIFNYIDGQWVPNSKGEYTYDQDGNIVEEYVYTYTNDQWIPANHNKASYDAQGRQTAYESYYWDGTNWTAAADKQEYAYNDAGLVTLYSFSKWQTDSKSWLNYYRVEQTFDSDNHITLQESKFWNKTLQNWGGVEDYGYGTVYNTKTDFQYDERGRRLSEKAQTAYTPNDYTPTCDMEYSYPVIDNGSQLYCETYMYRADGTTRWLNGKLTKQYDTKGNLVYDIESKDIDDGMGMLTYYDDAYTYDERGNMLTSKSWTYTKDKENKRLAEISEQLVYDNNNNVIDAYYQQGQGTSDNDWVNATRFTYQYEQDTVRVEKLGYRWDGSEFVPNFGDGVRYDYNTPVSDLVTWISGPTYHKFLETMDYYPLNDSEWDYRSFKYYYSEVNATSIASTRTSKAMTLKSTLIDNTIEIAGNGNVDVKVYSLNGSILIHSTNKTIVADHLPQGIYVIDINGNRTKIVKR